MTTSTTSELGFFPGTVSSWNGFQDVIPNEVIVCPTDTKIVKKGDGTHLFKDLPNGPSLNIVNVEQANSDVLSSLTSQNENEVIVIANGIYAASTESYLDVMGQVSTIQQAMSTQSTNLSTIATDFGFLNTGITTANNNDLAVITNNKMSPGISQNSLLVSDTATSIYITNVEFYSDAGCTTLVTSFYSNATYYCKVSYSHDTVDIALLTVGLTTTNSSVTITQTSPGIFQLVVGGGLTGTVVFVASATYQSDSSTVNVTIGSNGVPPMLITSIGLFSDSNCTVPVTSFNNDTTYYAKITAAGGGGTQNTNTYTLTSNSGYVVSTNIANGVFSLAVGEAPVAAGIILIATSTYGSDSITKQKVTTLNSWPAITVTGVGIFSDAGCTTAVTSFNNNTTYYSKITATGGAGASNTYQLASNNAGVVVTAVGAGVFSLAVGAIASAGTVSLSPTVSCSNSTKVGTSKSVPLNSWPAINITSVGFYSDAGCTAGVGSFNNNTTYYSKITATGGAGVANTYLMTSNNGYVVVSPLGGGVFSLTVGAVPTSTTVTLSSAVQCTNSASNASGNSPVPLNSWPAIGISGIGFYADAGCTVGVGSFDNNTVYYSQVFASGGNAGSNTYSMSSNNGYVTATYIGGGRFSINVGGVPTAAAVTLTANVSCTNGGTAAAAAIWLNSFPPITISSFDLYLDAGCTQRADIDVLGIRPDMRGFRAIYGDANNYVLFYAKVVASGGGGNASIYNYSLGLPSFVAFGSLVVTNLGNGVFQISGGIMYGGTFSAANYPNIIVSYGAYSAQAALPGIYILSMYMDTGPAE